MKNIFITCVIAIGLMTHYASAAGMNVLISDTRPYQGDTVVITINGKEKPRSLTFNNAEVNVFAYRSGSMAVIPIPASQKVGAYALSIAFEHGETFTRTITVRAKKFVTVVLGIPKELGLTTQGLTTKLAEEKVSIDAAIASTTPEAMFQKSFGLPLKNNTNITSTFGEIRKTGDSVIRHWGIDIKAPAGSVVGAISGGVVKRVYTDTVYGKVIIIDHGEGIYSLYMHLQSQLVKEGDRIERGTLIGRVGNTGYSTAPHLHLSIKVNSISVDPTRFVMGFK